MDVLYEKYYDGQTTTITKYVYANGVRVAKLTSSGTVQYYLGDHLGSTRQLRDSNRNLVFSAEYEPFGKPYSVSGSEAYKFTGERHDDRTGLVYLRARQYDPDLGRFVSADPILGALPYPQSLNRHVYVVNNPLRYTDPTGRLLDIVAAAFGAVVRAVVSPLSSTPVFLGDFCHPLGTLVLNLTRDTFIVNDEGSLHDKLPAYVDIAGSLRRTFSSRYIFFIEGAT